MYCKDFIVGHNMRDFVYPEYPLPQGDLVQKMVPNMWRKWVEETKEDLHASFYVETGTEQFRIEKYIKNAEDAGACLSILRDYMPKIVLFQKYCMLATTKYPEISWESMIQALDLA